MWPMGQRPGPADKSDPVVAEEVSMAACGKPKSSVAQSPRPQGRACAGRAHAGVADTGCSNSDSTGEVSCFMMGTNSKTKNA